METIFMNAENSKTNEPHEFVLNLSKRVDLRSLNKQITNIEDNYWIQDYSLKTA